MKRTKAEQAADDRESVRSNIEGLGAQGALRWATKELGAATLPADHKRRMLVLTIRESVRVLAVDMLRGRRLAAAHTIGLRSLGVKVALLLAVASSASAQSIVYTNIVNGQRVSAIVKVVRVVTPAAPVPPSIVTTDVLPRNYKTPLGARSYTPPIAAPVSSSRPVKAPQPWFINGIYAGPSPTGNWMATSIGRPIVDVRIIDTPLRPR